MKCIFESPRCYVLITFLFLSTKGNKKGPLGRWDFDTQEEYSDYMNNKEALPKYVVYTQYTQGHTSSKSCIYLDLIFCF